MTTHDLELRIDGTQPLHQQLIDRAAAVCERAETLGGRGRLVMRCSGLPTGAASTGTTIVQVSRWERILRRLERLPMATVAVAEGDCGGVALEAFLAADFRIATPDARLALPVAAAGTWPGMALYRLVRQGGNAVAIRRAILFGELIDVLNALALNLVDELAEDVATALAAFPPAGVGTGAEIAIRRQLIADAATTDFDEALGAHLAACDRMLRRAHAEAEVAS